MNSTGQTARQLPVLGHYTRLNNSGSTNSSSAVLKWLRFNKLRFSGAQVAPWVCLYNQNTGCMTVVFDMNTLPT